SAKSKRGKESIAYTSGMATIQLIYNLYKACDEIHFSFYIYGVKFILFDFYEQQYGVHFKYVDFLNYETVKESITENTKALFIETISNPQMQEVDVDPYYILSKKHRLLTIIDNTFLTPYLSTPL